MCKSYPCINTSFCTNTIPTGADKANGPSHYQQLPGGKGGSLCSQLVSNNTRSMGLANNNVLPVGTDAGALSNKTKPCNTVFFRGETQNIPGGTGTSGEKGHCRGTIDPGKLCLSNLPSGEEGMGTKTGSQPQEPQLLHTNRALQDGGHRSLIALDSWSATTFSLVGAQPPSTYISLSRHHCQRERAS